MKYLLILLLISTPIHANTDAEVELIDFGIGLGVCTVMLAQVNYGGLDKQAVIAYWAGIAKLAGVNFIDYQHGCRRLIYLHEQSHTIEIETQPTA